MKKGVKLLFIGALFELIPSLISLINGALLMIPDYGVEILYVLSAITVIGALLEFVGFILYLIGVIKLKKEYPHFITAYVLIIISLVCVGVSFLNTALMLITGNAALSYLSTIVGFIHDVASYTARFFVVRSIGLMIGECRKLSDNIYKLYYVAIGVWLLSSFFDAIPEASTFMETATSLLFTAIDVMMVVLLGKANKILSADQTSYYY